MTLYCGIDLHANNSVIAIIDDQDQVHFEKRLPNDLHTLLGALAPFRDALAGCVVESTYNWYWLVDGLMDAGIPVHLAHTGGIVQYAGLKHSNDESDARHLAHVFRLGILPQGYIMPKEPRAVRDLLRRRLLLVHQRTLNLLSLQSLITRYTGERLSATQVKALDVDTWRERLPEPMVVGTLVTAQSMRSLDGLIDVLEEDVHRRLHDQADFRLLTTIPGVGKILGATIALETGTIQRFPGPGHYASYARCTNTEKISNGKIKGRGNKKNGNKYLAWAFMEAAHHAAIWSPPIKQFYHRRKAKRHILVAKKTVANKLARACYHMLTNQEAFDVKRAFG